MQSARQSNRTIIMNPNTTITIKKEMEETPAEDSSVDANFYHQRKEMLSEYKELFAALFRLPDKDVQQKVFRCINAKYRSVETQTDPVKIVPVLAVESKDEKVNVDTNIKRELVSSPSKGTCSETLSQNETTPKKRRKRRRKVSQPQVNKESRVALAKKKQMAKMNNPQNQKKRGSGDMHRQDGATKRPRLDSTLSDCSYLNCVVDEIDKQTDLGCKEKFVQNIIKECILADLTLENGLLPIHDSIVRNQLTTLNIQIFIWSEWKGVDLNDLLTDDDEDLLQLAITHNCSPDIVNLLLTKGLNPNCLDGQGNTVIHLAVLNDVDQRSLILLMKSIDTKILLTLNDDGYTSLQLAIRQDCYLLAECLLNIMDERLSGDIFYKRSQDILETNETIRKKQFQSYYENVCTQMDMDDESGAGGCIINNHEMKQNLLQAPDMRSGNTALFFAIENQSEHLIYFLLAHLTDPRTENLSGLDCKTFFSEFGKTLNLSLNIDGAMEKVIKLLS